MQQMFKVIHKFVLSGSHKL